VTLSGDRLARLEAAEDRLVALRRDLHRHPEVARQEHATTARVAAELRALGLEPHPLSSGTGLWCDVVGEPGPLVVLRADIDALPLQDQKQVEYRSEVDGVCHACGHDVHTAALLGAAVALVGEPLPGTVRLLFQPAEEVMPGGALDALADGCLDGAEAVLGLHCDPTLDVGTVGLREGPLTSAADLLTITLRGPGGHTSRPHATVDLIHVLAALATGLPAALSRAVDPRAGLCLTWGHISAGRAANAIPDEGRLVGTVRVLDHSWWERLPRLVERFARELVATSGADIEVHCLRGVPPVINDAGLIALMAEVVREQIGAVGVVPTAQSLGGEDFGWYLEKTPGAMVRLGVRTPGSAVVHDLHQPGFDVDESAIAIGARLLAGAATTFLAPGRAEALKAKR
jgi:amidohydrolase